MPFWPPLAAAQFRAAATTQLAAIRAQLIRIEKNQEQIMSDQATEAAAAAEIETDVTAIGAGVTSIKTEIAALQQANPGIDWTALNQAVADLDTATASVTAAGTAAPPAAPPAS